VEWVDYPSQIKIKLKLTLMQNTEHVLHAVVLTAVLYLLMFYGLKQTSNVAFDRSVLVGCVALIYMILYGHQFPPTKLNPNIF
jgi:hypothetical protein